MQYRASASDNQLEERIREPEYKCLYPFRVGKKQKQTNKQWKMVKKAYRIMGHDHESKLLVIGVLEKKTKERRQKKAYLKI